MPKASDEQPSTSTGDPSSDTASAMSGGEALPVGEKEEEEKEEEEVFTAKIHLESKNCVEYAPRCVYCALITLTH